MNNTITFHKCPNLQQALELMATQRDTCKVIAGGTDLLIEIRKEDKKLDGIDTIIDIHDIPELKHISITNEVCSIGSCCTHSEIGKNDIICHHFPVLKLAVDKIGSPQIRNVATIGGNICNLAACADSIAPLLIYDAKVKLCSAAGERIVPLENILLKPYSADIHKNEILTHIFLPIPDDKWKYSFYKLGRRQGVSISRLSYAVMLKSEENIIQEIRFAFGALFAVPKRLYELENELHNQKISEMLWKDTSRNVAQQILDKTGIRWSTTYKLPTLQQLLFTSLTNLT